MGLNYSAISSFVKTVAVHPATKSAAVATIISGGLQAAIIAGCVIPQFAVILGPIAGVFIYNVLPPPIKADVDKAIDDVEKITSELPQSYSEPTDFPNAPNQNPTPNNLNK